MARDPKETVGECLRWLARHVEELKGLPDWKETAQLLRRCAVRHELLERAHDEAAEVFVDMMLRNEELREEREALLQAVRELQARGPKP